MDHLEEEKHLQLRGGVARSTISSYDSKWQKFVFFVSRLDRHVAGWEDRIIYYVVHLTNQGYAPSTVRSHLSAIRFKLKTDGQKLEENHFVLKLLLKLCLKSYVAHKAKLPVTQVIFEAIMAAEAKLFRAIFAAAYYGLFRVGEVTASPHNLLRQHVGITKQGGDIIRMLLLTSKTAQVPGLPQTIWIKHVHKKGNCCPVTVIKTYTHIRLLILPDHLPPGTNSGVSCHWH